MVGANHTEGPQFGPHYDNGQCIPDEIPFGERVGSAPVAAFRVAPLLVRVAGAICIVLPLDQGNPSNTAYSYLRSDPTRRFAVSLATRPLRAEAKQSNNMHESHEGWNPVGSATTGLSSLAMRSLSESHRLDTRPQISSVCLRSLTGTAGAIEGVSHRIERNCSCS